MPVTGPARWTPLRRRLLWLDCTAGLLVGVAVLLFAEWLSQSYALPWTLVVFVGLANVSYGLYSLSLAMRRNRPMVLIRVLVAANLLWSVICLALLLGFRETASVLGLGVLLAEGLFVGTLGLCEWWSRDLLRKA